MNALRFAVSIAVVMASTVPGLAASPAPPGAASCSSCHSNAAATASPITRLYGRNAAETATAMAGFRDGSVPSTVMGRIAKGFSDDEVRAIAAWLAEQK